MPSQRAETHARSTARQGSTALRRSSREVRTLLLEAAMSEFSRRSYTETTIQDIARTAGLGVSAVYHHFDSKADLYCQAALEPFLNFLDEFSETWGRQRGEPWDEVKLLEVFISELYTKIREHRNALIEIASRRDHLDQMIFDELRKASTRMFLELRVIGEEEAALRKFFPKEGVELTIRFITAMVTSMAVFDEWLAPSFPAPVPHDQLFDQMARFCLWGLARAPMRGTGESPPVHSEHHHDWHD